MFGILFKAQVKPDKRKDFIKFIQWDASVAQKKEGGTLRFDLYQDPKNKNAFYVYELYQDREAFKVHQGNDPYQLWEPTVEKEMLVGRLQHFFKSNSLCALGDRLCDKDQNELERLNECVATMERRRGAKAKAWFGKVLSDELVFRRANGTVIDKQAFLNGLDSPNPFVSRRTEGIRVMPLDDRALVTLIVRTKKRDGTTSRYRNIRLFSKQDKSWTLEAWYNYEST